jgi:tetratricopeptide (TPR) repeat protein
MILIYLDMMMVLRLLLLVPFLWSVTLSQTPDLLTKFRLAQSYEQAGNYEQAAVLYQELLTKDPSNSTYSEFLSRVYVQLKRYDEAIALLQKRMLLNPYDITLRGGLGSVYHRAGRDKEATTEWDKAIQLDPKNPNVYRSVANVLLENRLLDRAADLYRRGRVACDDPNLFTLELAHLLSISMDFAGATTEYLRWLRQNPAQLSFVQNRMSAFTGKEEARTAARDAVSAELRSGDDPRLYELLAWLYMEGKNLEDAFEVYKKLDGLTNAKGAGLYAFAERAFKERAFDVAARAYLEAINVPLAPARLPFAKYGYANALKELGTRSDTLARASVDVGTPATESQPRYAGAIASFEEVIREYPHSEFSAKSYYQIGMIQIERYFDLDGSLSAFENVEKELPGRDPVQFDVRLRIAEVLTAKGDTAGAARRLLTAVNAPTALPDQQDEAGYRLAELEYYGGKFASAIEKLDAISANPQANFANDALSLRSFLHENQSTAEPALQQFSRADFLARQRRYTEAIPIFLKVIQQYPQALLVDDALMKVASLQAKSRLFTDAIASYQRLLTEFRESSIALDGAQFNVGDLYQYGLNDKVKAIAAYEKLLTEHPQSLLADRARKRIRELRGDTF